MRSNRNIVLSYVKTLIIMLSAIMTIGLTGCGKDNSTSPNSNESIAEVARQDSGLSTFNRVLVTAGLEGKLKADGSYTVFAPTDSAFSALPDGFIDGLSNDQLKQILSYHVLSKAIHSDYIRNSNSFQTIEGDSIFILTGSGDLRLNHNARITAADKEASNGIIHKIDHVLLPDSYLSVFNIIHKRSALAKFACHCTSGRTHLDDVMNDENSEFTVFAPTDNAFDNMDIDVDNISDENLKNILSYHIINKKILSDELTDGETLMTRSGEAITISVDGDGNISINGGKAVVRQVDLEGKNGVVYIIDSVLIPPNN